MTASQHPNWRVTIALGLVAAGVVAGALGRADEPADAATRPATCADLAPCLHLWPPGAPRTGPGDRVRLVVAIIMGCHWEPCDRG
ncbi:hypothetical protein [Scleromatobacter humisilvae]|uniref:Uncharacterized protein n=1 Tax=Scleromatobacter humisilvae TaxID=2897159 RepID=A0A9X1YQ11_9BURK|nr:hypothetical protein [Scleromatobacter humisilvae]MCK9689260.1 hypothetical protein [Scleromatobacter humisilvae]